MLERKQKLTAFDLAIFKDTPVWAVAQAVDFEDTRQINKLLEDASDSIIDYREPYFSMTLLHWAVFNRRYNACEMLLEMGADPNIRIYNGETALVEAAGIRETSDYLRLLLQHGGEVNTLVDTTANRSLKTPLFAAAGSRLESVKILVEAGADIDYRPHQMHSVWLYASIKDRIDIMSYLIIEKCASFDGPAGINSDGDTLHIENRLRFMAFELDSPEYKMKMQLVDFLEERGVDYRNAPIPYLLRNRDPEYLRRY